MKKYLIVVFTIFLLISCNKIETNQTLDKKDIEYIKNLNLLTDGENVYKFYSEYKKDVAGNFYTDRRIATYWIDRRNSKKNEINYAYYKEIKRIDTVFNAGAGYTPYILVTKTNGNTFKVSVDGDKKEIRDFFEGVLREWKTKR
ncbi:hypothetical protein SGQ83_02315 [Flavobacterium sp. Fl-318]|uniref:Lipoprotein n=1 Tax=Flavobacterium cupriresistens TaxID=2893885 RepID=A0ABU4R6L1_9FLAO|nr:MULTISPECIES: hypothetical protein [unclassified Flavobacterium]MDX6188168.1 hypothetical protein [Flavobacterium sp. Fl-318]UFH41912.1 hypothetical protein LNP23_19140 [Flavobacterium sp. F-323]